jgi:hypothetical protein
VNATRLLVVAAVSLVVAAPAAPAAAVVNEADAALTITTISPRTPRPDDRLVVRGTVRNTGAAVLRGASVRLRVSHTPVTSRGQLAAQAASTGRIGVTVGDPGGTLALTDLAPGATTDYTVVADVARLDLPRTGAYPLAVEVRAPGSTLARVRTWLPFTAKRPGLEPLRLSWLWPLVDRPDRRADGAYPTDRLAALVRPGGRLDVLLQAAATARARGVPLTYAVDPALLEALTDMTNGYVVGPSLRAGTPGTGGPAASTFLAALRALAAVDPVLALPYGDPDVVALVRAGRAADVQLAAAAPAFPQLVESALGVTPLNGTAWPPDGLVTREALEAMPGVGTIVLSGAALPPAPALPYTPDAHAQLPAAAGGRVRALVSDAGLDRLVAAAPRTVTAARLDEQRFLAETLVLAGERPSSARSVLITPPRRFAPPAGWARALLADTAAAPWMRPAALLAPSTADSSALRRPLTYPRSAKRAELAAEVFTGSRSVTALSRDLGAFRAVLTDVDDPAVVGLQRALLRCESSAWRQDPADGRRLRAATVAALAEQRRRVRITSSGEVALGSTTSTIAVSVANDLHQPVRVQLRLRSNQARLAAGGTGVSTVGAGRQKQVEVRVRTATGGVFPIYVSLLTPDGQPYGRPVKILVHSTRYGAAAVSITVGAFAVLLAAAVWRLTRRIRAARQPA